MTDKQLFIFPEVRVVEASAGSGKTYALAKRYVQLILNPSEGADAAVPLRNILAITFTNKATIEMKERILEFLKKIALNAFSNAEEERDIMGSLGMHPDVARRKAFLSMDHILRNYSFFQVQTIDSFVNALISGCAFRLNLSSWFEIKTDHKSYLAYSLDTLIERAERDPAVHKVFVDFLRQYLHIENRQGWFPKKSILSLMEQLYAHGNTYGGSFHKLNTGTPDTLFHFKRNVLVHLEELVRRLPKGTDKRFAGGLETFLSHSRASFRVDEVSSYFAREAFPVNKGHETPAEVQALWDSIRYGLRSLCEHEAYSFFSCYIDIFHLVLGDFRALTSKDDVLFLSELNRQANRLFTGDAIPVPELYYRLATRFKHFLIDEFQDTSELQWRNLVPMVEEILSTGGSLFYVGDKKQAIYRFRGGDPTLFDRIPEQFSMFKPGHEILDKNYRSHREIVAFNNQVFSEDNLARFIAESEAGDDLFSTADVKEVLRVFSDSAQCHRGEFDGGYVRIEHIEADSAGEKNAVIRGRLAGLIRQLRERFSFRDIAVLTRDNRDVELVTGWLLQEKIPVESDKTLNLRENPRIKELISFLQFLNSPIDDLAFASFITGEVFTRAAGLAADDMRQLLFQLHAQRSRRGSEYLYPEFRSRYPEAWNTFVEELFVSVGYVPLYELIVSIYRKFGVVSGFPEDHAFFMRLLELVKQQEQERTGLGSFLEYYREADDNDMFVTVTDTDCVRLLTIHKSKGLEFPVVVIPFFEMSVNVSGRGGPGFISRRTETGGLSLVRLNKKHAVFSDELREHYREEYRKAFIDELNTAYVALTRPRCELYAFIPRKASLSINLARHLIQDPLVEKGSPGSYPAKKASKSSELHAIPPPEYREWLGFLKEEFRNDVAADRRSVRRGEFLHAVFSHLIPGGERAVEAALERAAADFPAYRELDEARDVVARMLATDGLSRFFQVTDGSAFAEKEVVDASGRTRRIDRLIVKEREVWVLDYKSSHEGEDAHRSQVREYLAIVTGIYPGREVKGFILYLDTSAVAEVAPSDGIAPVQSRGSRDRKETA